MYDVITVGSSTVDVFADSDSELIKIKTLHGTEELIAYPNGSKILITNLKFLTGGGGTNTAVSLSRLGHKVGYLGKIGKESNSKIILDMLKSENIDFVGVRGKGLPGYSVILKSLEQDRTILAYKGINNDLGFDEINFKKIKTNWFYFSSMMGKSFDTLKKLALYAMKNKIKIVFNPSNYLAEKGAVYLREILENCEILVLNKEEAELLAGKNDHKNLVMALKKFGPKIVVMTDGKDGAYVDDGYYYYTIEPERIKVIETTGAGDSFASSFLSGMIRKNDIEFALKLAQTNAESVIQHKGAKEILLTYRKACSIMKNKKYKITKTRLKPQSLRG